MPNKGKKLSFKQKGFAQSFVTGNEPGNATQAALENYNVKDRRMASVIGCRNLQKPEVQSEIEKIMEDHKVTDKALMEELKEGLNAKVVTKYEGQAEETKIPDHNIRHKYWQDAAKIKGWLKERFDVRSFNIDAQLESLTDEDFADLLKSFLISLKNAKPIQNITDLPRGEKKVVGGTKGGN